MILRRVENIVIRLEPRYSKYLNNIFNYSNIFPSCWAGSRVQYSKEDLTGCGSAEKPRKWQNQPCCQFIKTASRDNTLSYEYYSFHNSTTPQNRLNTMIRFKVDNLILSQFTNNIIDSKLINITLVEIDANREVWWVDSNHWLVWTLSCHYVHSHNNGSKVNKQKI